MLEGLTLARFADHLGERFHVRLPGSAGALEVELIRADPLPAGRSPGRKQPFVLEFRGPLEPRLGQGTWTLEHESLAKLDLFVVPVGPDGQGLCYEAIFN